MDEGHTISTKPEGSSLPSLVVSKVGFEHLIACNEVSFRTPVTNPFLPACRLNLSVPRFSENNPYKMVHD